MTGGRKKMICVDELLPQPIPAPLGGKARMSGIQYGYQ